MVFYGNRDYSGISYNNLIQGGLCITAELLNHYQNANHLQASMFTMVKHPTNKAMNSISKLTSARHKIEINK